MSFFRRFRRLILACCATLVASALTFPIFAAGRGELEVNVVDRDTNAPVAVRMHLRDAKGKPVRIPKVPYHNDHFVFEGKIILDLPLGAYSFEMERGPEYRIRNGTFVLERDAKDSTTVDMPRFYDMKKEGWWSGDLHIQREAKDLDLLMRAEDLHVAPVVTWGTDVPSSIKPPAADKALLKLESRRFVHLLTGRDRREAGELLFFNLNEPLALAGIKGETPSAASFMEQARRQGTGHIDIGRPYSWDLPVWIATGMVHSVNVFGDHLLRDGGGIELPGKPRETIRFGGSQGLGRYSLDVYYHLLNCGIRLPPTAGSGSGVNTNPIGYNRMYVHCGEEFTYEKWWENLRKGRVVVTNGPLLQPRINGELPGHVFQAEEGKSVQLQIELNLGTREKIEYLEIVQDGKSVHESRLDEWAKRNGQLPPMTFDKSGWLLIRVVTNNAQTFRGAFSAPYYVEVGYQPRISKKSAQYFLDWVVERAKRLKIDDPDARTEVIAYHRQARDFWQNLVDKANAE